MVVVIQSSLQSLRNSPLQIILDKTFWGLRKLIAGGFLIFLLASLKLLGSIASLTIQSTRLGLAILICHYMFTPKNMRDTSKRLDDLEIF